MPLTEEHHHIINQICFHLEHNMVDNPDHALDHIWMQGLYTDFEWRTCIVSKLAQDPTLNINTIFLEQSVTLGITSWHALYSSFVIEAQKNSLFPNLSDLVKDIQSRKDHFRFIRQITEEERGINIKVYFATIKTENQLEQFQGKWCRLISKKHKIIEDPHDQELYNKNGTTLVTVDMDKMFYLSDHSNRHQDSAKPVLMHLVVDEKTFPKILKSKMKADRTIPIKALTDWSNVWMEGSWHLASAVYGAFAGLDFDLHKLVNITHQQVEHRRQCKRSLLRNAHQPSVNISQVRPDVQGNVGPISNIKRGKKHDQARKTLVDGRNYMFDFYINMLSCSTLYKGQVQKWRKLAFNSTISLEGVSRTTVCGFCQNGYSAMLHLDADDPTHTYGLRFFRPSTLLPTEYQMVLPTIQITDSNTNGLVIAQDTGSITVWAGIKLMHTNSLGVYETLNKGMAPGMVIVQKPRTFSRTHNLSEESADYLQEKEKATIRKDMKTSGFIF